MNIILLSIISLFLGPTVQTALWQAMASLVWSAFLLTQLSLQLTGSELYSWLALAALALNPLLISTLGLESYFSPPSLFLRYIVITAKDGLCWQSHLDY